MVICFRSRCHEHVPIVLFSPTQFDSILSYSCNLVYGASSYAWMGPNISELECTTDVIAANRFQRPALWLRARDTLLAGPIQHFENRTDVSVPG